MRCSRSPIRECSHFLKITRGGLRNATSLQVFLDLDFTLMEMNPFTLDSEGKPFPLDMRGELDDTAAFKSGKKCVPSDHRDQSVCMDMCLPKVMPLTVKCYQMCSTHRAQAQLQAVSPFLAAGGASWSSPCPLAGA